MAEPTFQQLTDQVQRLTQRVAALEQELGMRRRAAAEPAPSPTALLQPEVRADAKRAPNLESSVGLQLVNRVGAITLILGIAFFFRYAAEKNWIGETMRVVLGIAGGLLLLGGGELAFRRGQRVFAQGITGAGVAIVYLAIYASFGAYHLVSIPVAFGGMAAATALAAYLAPRYASQAIAVLALFGAFLAPWLLQGNAVSPWFVPLYIAALDAGFLALARKYSWTWCGWLALAGTALFTADMSGAPLNVALGLYYALFAFQPNPQLFAVAHVLLLGRATFWPARFTVYASELLAMSLAGVAVVRWRGWFRYSGLPVAAAGVSWFAAEWGNTVSFTDAGALSTLIVLFVGFLIAAYSRVTQPMSNAELAAIPLGAVFYFAACYKVLVLRAGNGPALYAALLALGLAGLYGAMAYRLRHLPLPNLAGPLSGGIAVAFFTIAIPIAFSSFRITVAWALEGAALVWIGAKRGISTARSFGLLVLLLAVLQFFISDLTVANARFVTAVGLAAALFLAAVWSRNPIPGITGHFVLLTAIALEVTDWAAKYHADNRTNVASAAISILFAAYAVALVALGTGTRTVANRYMGLVLIALVVVKLYLYDVWQLDMVYRFIAFAALGALLLTMSFLYSRFKNRIAHWLKTDEVRQPGASATHPPQPQG